MSEYFQRVANDVLKASEEITARMEDGISAILGDLSSTPPTSSGSGSATPPTSPEFDNVDDDFEIEEEFMGSPLNGIADSVLGDLMQNSVRIISVPAVAFALLVG